MDIGFLDRRLELQSFTTSTNASGQEVKTYTTAVTVWARQEVSGGTSKFENDQDKSINQVAFIIRFRTDIKANWQLKMEGETFDVIAVLPAKIKGEFSRRRFLRIISESKF